MGEGEKETRGGIERESSSKKEGNPKFPNFIKKKHTYNRVTPSHKKECGYPEGDSH